VAMVHRALDAAQAGGRPLHHPSDGSFAVTQNTRVMASQRLPLRSQRKAWEARQWQGQDPWR
jgi:hypothetical protein